jgi:hypothetical protein
MARKCGNLQNMKSIQNIRKMVRISVDHRVLTLISYEIASLA